MHSANDVRRLLLLLLLLLLCVQITRITPSIDKHDCCLQCESLPYQWQAEGHWTPNCHGAVFVSTAASNFLHTLQTLQADGCGKSPLPSTTTYFPGAALRDSLAVAADADAPCNCVLLDAGDAIAQTVKPGEAGDDMTFCRPLPSGMLTMRGELDLMVGGAALWARVGALVLALVQYAGLVGEYRRPVASPCFPWMFWIERWLVVAACGFNGASFGQVFLSPRHAAVLTQVTTPANSPPRAPRRALALGQR